MEENKKENIHFVQFENRKIPKFLEVKNSDWITYGEKNDYPYYLNQLYMRSSYHCAIINAKVKYICGAGWTYSKSGVNTLEQRAMAEKLIKQPFSETNLNESTLRWAYDLEKYNGFAILVRWNNSRKGGTLEYIDFSNVRANADRSVFFYTKNWYLTDQRGNKKINKKPEEESDFQKFKAYDPNDRSGNQIYYYSFYHADQYVYPIPTYVGGVTWIENHIKYTDFQYKNISASFSPAKIINIYGKVPDQDKQADIVAGMKANFTGEDGERIVVNFAPSKELGIESQDQLVNDQSVLYKEIADQSLQNIFTAHEITSPMLLGIRTEGQLGGRSEMLDAFEIFQNSYVKYRQQIIENSINQLAQDFGIGIKLELKPNSPINAGDLISADKQNLLNAINAMNPTLQSKVVESMSKEQILALVGLKVQPTTTQTTLTKFQSAKVDLFAQFGIDASTVEEVEARDIPDTDPIRLEQFENDYLQFAKDALKLKSLDRTVLDLISKDKYITPDGIAKVAKVPVKDVQNAIGRLIDKGMINPSSENIEGVKTPVNELTKEGEQSIAEQPAKTESYKVMYRYDVAAGMGKPIIDGTRDFCRQLIGLNKLYTREEINLMSAKEDRNVWTLRGGWYHNPNTGINQPQCRHTWRQVIVKES